MKNLPIKKEIENLLKPERRSGVWKVKNKELYLKLTSKLWSPVASINPSDYNNFQEALDDTIACARVYKRFVEEGLYHPNTQVVVCKDDENNLTLMVTMPELKLDETGWDVLNTKLKDIILNTKLKDIIKRVGLDSDKGQFGDLNLNYNWGYDKKTKELYAHDLHIDFTTKQILDMAKDMKIK